MLSGCKVVSDLLWSPGIRTIPGRGLFPRGHFVARSHLCGGIPSPRNALRKRRRQPQPAQRAWVSQGPSPPNPPAFSGLLRPKTCFRLPGSAGYSGCTRLKALSADCWKSSQWLRVRMQPAIGLIRTPTGSCFLNTIVVDLDLIWPVMVANKRAGNVMKYLRSLAGRID